LSNRNVMQTRLDKLREYAVLLRKIGKAGILNPDLTRQMEALAGFRNVLAHDYLGIDHAKTYDVIKKELSWIESYTEAVEKFL